MKNMKSLKLLLVVGLMALFTGTATAQKDPNKAAQIRTMVMVGELGLDKQQEQKLLVLNKRMMNDRKSLKGKGKSAQDKGKADYATALKKILTSAQYSKWQARHGGQ